LNIYSENELKETETPRKIGISDFTTKPTNYYNLDVIVSGYLDFAERQAEREQTMTMADWANHLDRILTMSGEKLLSHSGTIIHEKAIDKATSEY